DLPRAEAIARGLGRLGVTWSCNAKANVPASTLKVLRDNGLRLLLVGYESGSQAILNNVKKGVRLDLAREFTRNAKALGIKIHGTFILGLPGETRETIEETITFARQIDPGSLQVSLAAPYPGTALHQEALGRGRVGHPPGPLVGFASVQQVADRDELVAHLAHAVDHRRKRCDQAKRRAEGALGVVQVDDGAGMGAVQDVAHLLRRRHRTQAFWLDRPEHAALLMTTERAEHRRVDHAPRRPEKTGRTARERPEQAVSATDLVLGSARAAEPEAPVRPAVARDLVPRGRDPSHGLGHTRRALADQEERRACVLVDQDVQDPLRPDRVGAVVERERDRSARSRAAPDAAGRQ